MACFVINPHNSFIIALNHYLFVPKIKSPWQFYNESENLCAPCLVESVNKTFKKILLHLPVRPPLPSVHFLQVDSAKLQNCMF